VDNAGSPKVPKRLSEYSSTQHDDLPQATRATPTPAPRRSQRTRQFVSLGVLALISASLPFVFLLLRPSAPIAQAPSAVVSPAPASVNPASPAANPAVSPTVSPDSVLGHHPYEEAPAAELDPISADGDIKMRKSAAAKFRAMTDAAQADGVSLVPISGFRSEDEQTQLFFEVSAERGQTPSKRSDVSAPPGYSEHHTGYAVDIGDGDRADTNLSESFETTEAFKWLSQNAASYGFEISFPRNNPDKVSYEPWHWRFVGDRQSLELFYRGKGK
jgi:zinc D-Ala-D-Ala carboxypeptidase